jgi:predicted  nucleic acid-binding Zn-ribbon protein
LKVSGSSLFWEGGARKKMAEHYKASMKAKRLLEQELMPELEKIQNKVNEINDQLKAIEKRVTGIQGQLTNIDTKLPQKA